VDAGFGGELAFGAIFVKTGHGEPTVGRNVFGVVHRDQAVGVAGIADDEDADIGGGVFGDGLALAGEDFAVDAEEVFALHAGSARDAADEEGPVDAGEADIDAGGGGDAVEEGKGAVVEFHANAVQSGQRFFVIALDEAEIDGLIGAEEGAGGDAEEEGVSDLTCGSGDGDCDGGFAHGKVGFKNKAGVQIGRLGREGKGKVGAELVMGA